METTKVKVDILYDENIGFLYHENNFVFETTIPTEWIEFSKYGTYIKSDYQIQMYQLILNEYKKTYPDYSFESDLDFDNYTITIL